MTFEDIIGQEEIVHRLRQEVEAGKLPHALLLNGPEGNGALPIAVALATQLLGKNGMTEQLQHPDLHFSFPIYKKDSNKPAVSEMFLSKWRDLLLSNPYFGYEEWMDAIGAENQQLMIYESESDSLQKKLNYKSNQGGYKIVIIWMAERMNATCANKLLKLLEEPPTGTLFLLISEHSEKMLSTILSRCQTIEVPKLTESDLRTALISRFSIDERMAENIARTSNGNMCAAIRQITDNSEQEAFFQLFVAIMRASYARKVKEMREWSEEVARLGRERQKRFLAYCQRMVRENFIYNFHQSELNYMNQDEANFAVKFAPFISEKNVIQLMEELNLVERDITQNGNARIIFFDFALKMTVLIKNR